MKNEYDDMAESEQFGVVVSKVQRIFFKTKDFLKPICFHLSADMCETNHKCRRENCWNKKALELKKLRPLQILFGDRKSLRC